jgi:hypothetical protein
MRHLLLVCSCGALAACADTRLPNSVCEASAYKCVGNMSLRCAADGSGWQVEADCASKALTCTSRGCLACEPGATLCKGQSLVRCNDEGTAVLPNPILTCDAAKGMTCDGSGCVNACELARSNRSYVGCEYWPVDLDNAVVEVGNAAAQQYAVALSNPSSLPAEVKVWVNEAPYGQPAQLKVLTTRIVAPEALELILLPSREVDGSAPGEYDTGTHTAVTANAYKIVSTAPIIAYQFNPLENVSVFSNDASLLIPTPALSTDATTTSGASYMVMGWPQTIATTSDPKTNFGEDLRAFLTIVGTRDATNVRVYLSTDIVGNGTTIPAKRKGDFLDFKLNPFDVLNLETGGFAADFTGSRIEADKPVVVYSGSEASDVPDFPDLTTRQCCADHLEEQLFPLPTLGTTFIAVSTSGRMQALKDAGGQITPRVEPEFFRLLPAGEFAALTTNLPAPDNQITIAGGKYVQLKTTQNFWIRSTEPLVVGQFMPSQDVSGIPSSLPGGDPSFILLPPVEQYRRDYLFLTPDKYAFDFFAVAAPATAKLTIDGRVLAAGLIPGPGKKISCIKEPVGKVKRSGATIETEYVAYKCQLSFPKVIAGKIPPDNLELGEQNDGVHRLKSDEPVGLVVYGFDAYVSYGYPGGTDLALINLK